MGYMEGLLGGFMGRKYAVEQQNLKAAQAASDREGRVYEALLNSPDPEIRAHALTGLLTSAQAPTRAGGIRGWLGEMQRNPAYEQIKALIGTPVPHEEQAMSLPSRSTTGMLTVPEQRPSLAQSPTAATEPGAPPLTTLEPAPEPAAAPITSTLRTTAEPATPTGGTRTVMGPRHLLLSPEEAILGQRRGAAQGDVEGEIAGLVSAGATPAEARAAVMRRLQRTSGMGVQSIAGELPDGTAAFGVFDRLPGSATYGKYIDPDTGQPLEGFRPRTTTGSISLGADRESIAREFYGVRASQLKGPQMAFVDAVMQQRKGQLTPKDALAAANRIIPNASAKDQADLADALVAGTAAQYAGGISATGGPPAAAGAAPGAAATPSAAPGVGAPPPGLSTTPTPAAPAGVPPAAVGPPPTGGRPSISSAIPPELAGANKQTGAPLPPAVQKSLSQAEATSALVDQALEALEPYKNDNNPETSYQLAEKYRAGVYDPVASATQQLSDLAGLQLSAQAQLTGGASRAIRYYIDRRQHVPLVPSPRQSAARRVGVPASIIGATTNIAANEGAPDSPKAMYNKLIAARENVTRFIDAVRSSSRETIRPMPSHGPGGAAGAAAVPTTHKDASGNWVISIP